MALKLAEKKEIVSAVSQLALQAPSAMVVDTTGISVEKMTPLRAQARACGVQLRVVRNTLARLAFQKTAYEPLASFCTGPSLMAFSMDHPGAAARLLVTFAKDNPQLTVKAALFDGRLFKADAVAQLAAVPTYPEALSRLLGVFKELSGGKLARTLMALKIKREGVA